MSASIQFKGLQQLIARFKTADSVVQAEAEKAVRDSLKRIKTEAQKKLVPGYGYKTGFLRRSVSYSVDIKRLRAVITAKAPYAAYVEFGTGTGVRIPKQLREYASQFKGKGIRKRNYPAKPFFFSAIFAELPRLKTNLKNVIKKTNKHISNK